MLYKRNGGLARLDQEPFLSNLGEWGQNNQIREVKVGVIQTLTLTEFTRVEGQDQGMMKMLFP